MQKFITTLCCVLLLVPAIVQGQGKPQWANSTVREIYYPAADYLVGFSVGNLREKETIEAAKKRVAKDAQAQVAENIRLTVSSKTSSYDRSDKFNQSEQLSAAFIAEVQTESNAEIAGIRTESYYDNTEGTIYAFAYIKRSDLISYYQNQIALHLNAIDGALQVATALAESGAKAKAYKQCEKAAGLTGKVYYAQDLLTAVDINASESGLQQQRTKNLENKLNEMLGKLENSLYIYVKCAEDMAFFAELVSSLLTENGCNCNFTESEQDATVVITLAPTHRCNEASSGNVFCYATTAMSIFDRHSNKTIKPMVGEFKGGWTDRNYDRAAEEAYRLLAREVADKALSYLKK